MDFLSLILFGVAAIFSAFVCKQNMNLAEQLTAAENRLVDLETQKSHTADFLSALETRVSNAVKIAERSSSGQLAEIQAQVRNTLESQLPTDLAGFSDYKKDVDSQLASLQSYFKMHHADIATLAKRQSELMNTAIQAEGNVCVMSHVDSCPKGFSKIGTFGTILHTPSNLLGKGFYVNGEYSRGWDWYHGGMCCRETEVKPTAQA